MILNKGNILKEDVNTQNIDDEIIHPVYRSKYDGWIYDSGLTIIMVQAAEGNDSESSEDVHKAKKKEAFLFNNAFAKACSGKTIGEAREYLRKELSKYATTDDLKADIEEYIEDRLETELYNEFESRLWDEMKKEKVNDEEWDMLTDKFNEIEWGDIDAYKKLIASVKDVRANREQAPEGYEEFEGYLNDQDQPLGVGAEVITRDGEHYWITFVDDWDDKYAWGSPNKSDIKTEQGYSIDKDDIRFVKPHAYNESLKEKQEPSNTQKESAKVREAISLITGNLAKSGGYKIEDTKIIIDPDGEKATFEFSKQVINRLKELGYGEDMGEQRYYAKEVNGKGYIFDKQFSETAPIAVEKTIEFAQQQVDKFNKEDSMNENKQLTEAVDKGQLAEFIKKAVEDLKISDAYNEIAPTWFFDMGAPNGLHLVIGYDSADNYNAEDLEHLALDKSGKYVVCAKLAVNVDDMQDDFDWDWYMPYDKETGDVWDTEMQIAKDEDYDVLAQDFINEFNKMEDLEIDEDGAIIEHEEVVEESKKDCDDKDDKCESCKKKPMKESVEDDLYVKYWIDEDHRDQGIADYFYDIADIEDGKEVVDRLIDFEDYACAELLSGEDVVLYGRDADDTWGDLDESCKKEEKCDGKDGKCESCNDKKSLKEDMSPIQEAVYNYMSADGVVNDDMFELLCDLVERVDDYNDEDDIHSAIDDGMIYDDDRWTAYRYYCNMGDPEDQMWEGLTNDVINICSRLAGNNNDDIEIEDEVVEETVEQNITESTGLKVKDVLDFELEDDGTETGGIPYKGYTVEDFLDEVAFSSDGVTFEFEDDEDKDITLESSVEDLNAILVQCGIKPIKK